MDRQEKKLIILGSIATAIVILVMLLSLRGKKAPDSSPPGVLTDERRSELFRSVPAGTSSALTKQQEADLFRAAKAPADASSSSSSAAAKPKASAAKAGPAPGAGPRSLSPKQESDLFKSVKVRATGGTTLSAQQQADLFKSAK